MFGFSSLALLCLQSSLSETRGKNRLSIGAHHHLLSFELGFVGRALLQLHSSLLLLLNFLHLDGILALFLLLTSQTLLFFSLPLSRLSLKSITLFLESTLVHLLPLLLLQVADQAFT